MIRSAPICFADNTPSSPTAPSPTTATVAPGFTFAASAANHPVPITSESASRLGIMSASRNVAGRDERAFGERHAHAGACAPTTRLEALT